MSGEILHGSIDSARLVDPESKPVLLEETGPGLSRAGFIGGSDVAAILGLSNWDTPLSIWEKKTGRYIEDPDPLKIKRFKRGKLWEEPAFGMLLEVLRDRGHEIHVVAENRRYQDGICPWLRCEIDREIIMDGEFCNVEIKTVHPFAAKEWGDSEDEDGQITDQVPIYYSTQSQHGLGITGIGRCVVGCLIGADDMTPYFVDRDDELIEDLREACNRFWHINIQGDIRPDPINMLDMKRLLWKINGKPAELDDDAFLALRQIAQIRKQMTGLKNVKEDLEFKVADCVRRFWNLDDVTPGDDDAQLLYKAMKVGTWKKQTVHNIDGDLLKMKYPKIRDEVDNPSTFRVLRMKDTF